VRATRKCDLLYEKALLAFFSHPVILGLYFSTGLMRAWSDVLNDQAFFKDIFS
jgi:hypothetical protein